MERFGLVGLPNAGKSSLYNALTGSNALAAPYPFATKDPNIGVAKVLDPRLDALAKMSESKKVVNATIEVVDIGGLVEGASKGEGLGNKFLANIREVDAIVFVLRAFVDDDIPGPSDPLEHLRVVELELDDAQVFERVTRTGNVVVHERAQHEDNRVDLADVGEKFVAETLAFAGALDQTADVDDFDGRVDNFLALRHLGERVETRVEHLGDADVRVFRGEGVRRSERIRASERVVQRRLARVGKTDESEALHTTQRRYGCDERRMRR